MAGENDDVFEVFEYEDCSNCGDGAAGHVEMVDGLGNSHAVCISEMLD